LPIFLPAPVITATCPCNFMSLIPFVRSSAGEEYPTVRQYVNDVKYCSDCSRRGLRD
jgi:hypothetical protein